MKIRLLSITIAAAIGLSACAPPHGQGPGAHPPGPSAEHGFNAVGTGLGYLILSPLLIAAGLIEGIVSLPYLITQDLHHLNRGMVQSGSQVDMERTYTYAYDEPLPSSDRSANTGRVFRHMHEATRHFQRVLMGYGVEDYNTYILTAVRTADRQGYTLYAVVRRPVGTIRVHDDATGRERTLRPGDDAYYQPHERDAGGRPLDVVIDWAGVPRTSIRTQKGQAVLMTIAANSVLMNRRSDEYWSAESRWITGGFRNIVAERDAYLKQRMGLARVDDDRTGGKRAGPG